MWRLRVRTARGHGHPFGKGPRPAEPHDPERRTLALLTSHTELTMPTAQPRVQDHLVADLGTHHVRTHLGDNADGIGTENVGHFQFDPRPTLSDPDVQMIQTRAAHIQHNLARFGPGLRNVVYLHNIQRAMLVDDGCLHGLILAIACRRGCTARRAPSMAHCPSGGPLTPSVSLPSRRSKTAHRRAASRACHRK